MTSPFPPRDWTAIHWPEIAAGCGGAVDRGVAAGGDRTARPAFAARHRRHDRRGLSGAGAGAVAGNACPATFLPLQPVGISTEHIDFPGTQTLSTEEALKNWMALGESVARAGVRKLVMVTSHGGNSAAMTLVAQELRAQRGLLAVTTSWSRFGAPEGLFSAEELRHGIHGGAVETSIMLARYRAACPPRGDRRFSLQRHRDGKAISLAFHAAAGAVRLAGAGSSSERRGGRCLAGFR